MCECLCVCVCVCVCVCALRPVIVEDVVPTWKASSWTHEYLCSTFGQERIAMTGVRVCLGYATYATLRHVANHSVMGARD